ncbi:MAG: hypothetical protein FWC20_05400 [Oscillospiraceae bacterium]|nr:hypothetical protein [Oscillospiraceae bacterium]MCL2278828.1 hypothetical protein [Oscillospiraceae bacterium]
MANNSNPNINNDTTITHSIQNSDLTVPKDKRAFLTYSADGLADCCLEEADDCIKLQFETNGFESATSIFSKTREEWFRFLANCAELDKLSEEYEFSISPDNLMVDVNLRPQVLIRDSKGADGKDFLSKYKALIGSVLQKRYKYEDYLSGGTDLYKKQKLLASLTSLDSVEEIKSELFEEYHTLVNKNKKSKQLVMKSSVRIGKVAIPTLLAALLAAGFFLWTAFFNDIPHKNDIIQANTHYIAGNYIDVQRVLRRYDLTELSFETRYFLSRSYVITEALTDAQKDNILMGLTLRTDPIIFDYWILLGRMQFDEAIDIAQRLGDDELLLFAYIKYEVVVRNDPTLSGEEMTVLLNHISGRIEGLQSARDAAAEEALDR